MAHNLDRNESTGKLSMFAVGETPWHREGVLLTQAPSFEDALHLAGVDYEVELRRLWCMRGEGRRLKETETGFATVRTDREEVLAIVGDDYKPLQNPDAFRVLTPLLDRGVATLETGGSLDGGRDAWMLVRFAINDPVVREVFTDEVVPFSLVTNNHSGHRVARIMNTPVRVVCANTLAMATKDRSRGLTVVHRGDAKVRMVEAAEQLYAGIVDRYKSIAEQFRFMKDTTLSVEAFERSVQDILAPLPDDLAAFPTSGERRTYDRQRDVALEKRQALEIKWLRGKGHVGNRSAWEAWNGAVEVLDHDGTLYPVRGSRVQSLIPGGRLANLKDDVLDAVLAECVEVAKHK